MFFKNKKYHNNLLVHILGKNTYIYSFFKRKNIYTCCMLCCNLDKDSSMWTGNEPKYLILWFVLFFFNNETN